MIVILLDLANMKSVKAFPMPVWSCRYQGKLLASQIQGRHLTVGSMQLELTKSKAVVRMVQGLVVASHGGNTAKNWQKKQCPWVPCCQHRWQASGSVFLSYIDIYMLE